MILAGLYGTTVAWMGTIIGAIILGVVVGGVARLILPGRQNISTLATVLVGFVAALVGGAFAQVLGVGDTQGVDWIKLTLQLGLAVIGIGMYSGWFFRR